MIQIERGPVKKRINVILDTDTHLALKVYAAQVGSSMSDVAWGSNSDVFTVTL